MRFTTKATMVMAIIIFLITPVYALQQTSGALSINITLGEQGFATYGLRNEDNQTATVKLSADGSIAKYIEFPKELTLEPDEFRYVNITTNVSSDYDGDPELNGVIYALKEGTQGGQVQLNIRLGKSVTLKIAEPPGRIKTNEPNTIGRTGVIIFIGTAVVLAVIVKSRKARKNRKYKLKVKEVENK